MSTDSLCRYQGWPRHGGQPAGTDRARVTLAALAAEGCGARGWWSVLREGLSHLSPRYRAGEAGHCAPAAACGVLLYQLARHGDTRLAVALGAGNVAPLIWLACAMRAGRRHSGDHGIIVCEPSPCLAQLARRRLREAGVSRYVDLRQDPPEPALSRIDQPLDCLLLNGYPSQMLAVLRQLRSRLRPGALVLAPRPGGACQDYADYLRHVRDPGSGFTSLALPGRQALELSVLA